MDNQALAIVLWVAAGICLVLLVMRRKRRKQKDFDD